MSLQAFFALLGGLLVLAFVANRLARWTRVPDAVVLILTGLLLGPVFGLVDARQYENITRGFGTLALILILFEGGLELDVRETLRHLGGGLMLSWSAYIITAAMAAGIARWSLGLSWDGSLLVGAVLGCVSSTIILPVLQQIPVRQPVRLTLLVESSIGDVLAVLTVGALLNFSLLHRSLLKGLIGGFVFEVGVSVVFGAAAGIAWTHRFTRHTGGKNTTAQRASPRSDFRPPSNDGFAEGAREPHTPVSPAQFFFWREYVGRERVRDNEVRRLRRRLETGKGREGILRGQEALDPETMSAVQGREKNREGQGARVRERDAQEQGPQGGA